MKLGIINQLSNEYYEAITKKRNTILTDEDNDFANILGNKKNK